jgi:hypothetical protein
MDSDINPGTKELIPSLEMAKREIELALQELTLESVIAEESRQSRSTFQPTISGLKSTSAEGNSAVPVLINMLSELKVYLERPEADAIKEITQLIKNIRKEIRGLRDDLGIDTSLTDIRDRLQRYRLMFEVVKLKLTLKALEAREAGKDAHYQLDRSIHALGKFVRTSKQNAEHRIERVRQAANKIYSTINKVHS